MLVTAIFFRTDAGLKINSPLIREKLGLFFTHITPVLSFSSLDIELKCGIPDFKFCKVNVSYKLNYGNLINEP
jgi:hypothetical protein